MTRKDYKLIASVLKNTDEIIDDYAREALAEMFADVLEKENPRFNRELFVFHSTLTESKREAIVSQVI